MLTSAMRGETLTPNPNECNSTLTSRTNNIYPYPYIDVNDRGHHLRISHTLRRQHYFLCRCSHFAVAVVCRHVEGQVSCDMRFTWLPRVRAVLRWLQGTTTHTGEMIWLFAEVTLFPFCGTREVFVWKCTTTVSARLGIEVILLLTRSYLVCLCIRMSG